MATLPREKDAVPRAGRWRRSLLLLLVAVAVLMAAGLLLRMYSERSGWSSVSTEIGNYWKSSLADGSTLELNTSTAVRYRLSQKVRLLELTSGEARFRVAHDSGRPFVVLARDTVVRAVGTEFTVRVRADGRVEVVVADGVVAVSHRGHQSVLSELLHGRAVPLEGGTAVPEKRMVTDDGGRLAVVEMSRVKIEAHDAWRNNLLVFEEAPLREIVEEFNRYDRRKLEIADPAIADVLLGGKYRPRDLEGFLQNLGAVMKIRIVEVRSDNGDGVVLRIYSDEAKRGPADKPATKPGK
jgi:transmembrane sensor